MDVTGEPVQLGDDDRAFAAPRLIEGGAQLRPQIEGVRALARLDLDILADELEAFVRGEAPDHLPLRLQAEAGLTLSVSRDAQIGDDF